MTSLQPLGGPGPSPFDAIRQTRPDGTEFWSARDLMPLLGYSKWERFEDVIERARTAAANTGQDPDLHASRLREASGRTERTDYHLTRYGAYLVAMNGDSRKAEIAAAQSYFAVKTREAETAPARPAVTGTAAIRAMLDEIDRTNQRVLELSEADARREAQIRQITARLDGVESRYDWFTALGYARMSGLPTSRSFLQRLGAAAARIARRDGQEPVPTQDARYGSVNQYPVSALDEAAELLGAKGGAA